MINFIVNTNSGKGRGNENLKKLVDYCYAKRVDYTIYITNAPGHARRLARDICARGGGTIAAVGGDGTFHEVLNGIDFTKASLGFIPSGRGNDYARGANLSLDPVRALKGILRGIPAETDYIDVSGVRCLNVAGTGLDVAVLERVEQKKNTKINYLLSLMYCLQHFEPYRVRVIANGEERALDCVMAGVCNGTSIGGGIKLSPLSVTDDGKLNVVVMTVPKNGKIMRALPKFVKGHHMDKEYTIHFECDEVRVESDAHYPVQLDGEIYRDLPLNCRIVKGGVKTFKLL